MSKRATGAAADLRKPLETLVPFDALVSRLGTRDKVNVERHLAYCQTESSPRHAIAWQRLLRAMGTLSSLPPVTTGQQAVSFYIADGKYKMQVFALEDNRDGKLQAYVQDILDDAVAAKLLAKPGRGATPGVYTLANDADQSLSIEHLDAQNTPNPAAFYKHMLGWNRRAVRITLPVDASDEQLMGAETLLALAASKWPVKKEEAAK